MLKDFQRETAKRIIEIFKGDGSRDQEQKRVMLSDEVGLGKTIMARAVVNEVRKLRKDVSPLATLSISTGSFRSTASCSDISMLLTKICLH